MDPAQERSRRRSRLVQALVTAIGGMTWAAEGALAGGAVTGLHGWWSGRPRGWRKGACWGAGIGGVVGTAYGWIMGSLVALELEHRREAAGGRGTET